MDDKEEGLHWTIHELTSKKELTLEGRAMNHCVASYVSNCRRGSKSVWSMQVDAEGHSARVLTIAMHNRSRNIVEVRGRFNAVPRQSGKNPKNKALGRPYRACWRALVLYCGSGLRPRSWGGRCGRTRRAHVAFGRVLVILLDKTIKPPNKKVDFAPTKSRFRA